MSKDRLADMFKTHEVVSDLRRRIRDRTSAASRLIYRIKSIDPNSAKLPSLLGQLRGLESKLIQNKQQLRGTLAKRQQLIARATMTFERNAGKRKKWLAAQRETTSELRAQVRLLRELRNTPVSFGSERGDLTSEHDYDVFIAHASEDKDDFVRPLALKLIDLELQVWYDEFSLFVGDSLRKSIDLGLSKSRFGLVVLSSAFFAKNWTQYELGGLVSREMEGTKVILPIWHKVTKNEVMRFSPTLVDKVALHSSFLSIEEMASKLLSAIRQK